MSDEPVIEPLRRPPGQDAVDALTFMIEGLIVKAFGMTAEQLEVGSAGVWIGYDPASDALTLTPVTPEELQRHE
nr:hypothetical protein [Brevundimonas diminuta]